MDKLSKKTPYVAIIDYGCGNVLSVKNMASNVGLNAVITDKEDVILNSSGIIFPGVGSFDNGMKKLKSKHLDLILKKAVLDRGIYFFGICLGMQLLFESSDEGLEKGMGLIKGKVKKFDNTEDQDIKIPHMGWNKISYKENILLNNLESDSRFYFVHSFYCKVEDSSESIASTTYVQIFDSVVNKGNIFGMQFHPEKSHRYGKIVFKNIKSIINSHVK